jgi:NDP-sugar pyrophosphorylase family protein
MCDRAVILAGGKGTRLRPYTVVLPKPLMPIGEYPILEVIVRQLAAQSFKRITMAVNHQANLIQAFFGDGSRWGVQIDYSLENEPLGTVGPLALVPDLPETFLLMNGDVLTDLDYRHLISKHHSSGNLFTISAAVRHHIIDYGVLETNEKNTLVGFREKPHVEYLVSMGVYVLDRRILGRVPHGTKFSFDDLMLDMLRTGDRVHVEPFTGYWLDIGRPDDYMQAIDEFDSKRNLFLAQNA